MWSASDIAGEITNTAEMLQQRAKLQKPGEPASDMEQGMVQNICTRLTICLKSPLLMLRFCMIVLALAPLRVA